MLALGVADRRRPPANTTIMQLCCNYIKFTYICIPVAINPTLMKHTLTLAALMGMSALQAQETHTLQHIAPEAATSMHNYWGSASNAWGYYVGHNYYGDEAFGEKYEINGSGAVVGVIAYLGGTSVSNQTASYKVHSVAGTGLPGAALATQSFTLGSAPTTGNTPHMQTFSSPVNVQDQFFVVLDLGDYSHDPLVGDTICLMSGPHGSRPESDNVFGRNVIRWHSHGAPNWKDFFTQNFTPVRTYFAIYPVMQGPATGIGEHHLGDAALHLFPMPFIDELNIRLDATSAEPLRIHLFDANGRLLKSEQHSVAIGEQFLRIDTQALAQGTYVVAFEQGSSRYARTIVK
jgi:hypothetical protein